MFRKFMLLAGVVGMISVAGADTIIPGGNVSGTWAASGSPFLIQGEITVPSGQTLNIEPGVQVIFQGHYKLTVSSNAILSAIGTQEDSISFSAQTADGWGGIRLLDSSDRSSFAYCVIQNGRAQGPNFPDYYGGGIYAHQTNLTITNSLIRYNIANCGGGVFLDSCSASSILGNTFEYNDVVSGPSYGAGGGIAYDHSGGLLRGNVFRYNHGWSYPGNSGAGAFICESSPIVKDNIFCSNTGNNSGMGTAIWTCSNSYPQLLNNLFYQNEGVTLYFNMYSSAQFIGNTVYQDNACFAINIYGASNMAGFNDIIWGNDDLIQVLGGCSLELSYSDVQGGYPGNGNINQDPLFATGPEGGYYLSQIAAGQGANSPCVDAGNPVTPVYGTTRTDGESDTGVPDMGFHYPVPEPIPPPQTITLTPQNPPIIIPPSGGRFAFEVLIANDTTVAASFDVWINMSVPGGIQFTIQGPIAISVPANSSLLRIRIITVPGSAPAGDYTCLGAIGDYPWSVIYSDQFPFTKLGSNRNWLGSDGWICTGELFPAEKVAATEIQPSAFLLPPCRPNPFNPSTVASYELPVASHVSLRVYDTAGRLVTTLVDGWREAGAHEVTFDGSGLAAGMYVARLQAGEFTASQKMVLLK